MKNSKRQDRSLQIWCMVCAWCINMVITRPWFMSYATPSLILSRLFTLFFLCWSLAKRKRKTKKEEAETKPHLKQETNFLISYHHPFPSFQILSLFLLFFFLSSFTSVPRGPGGDARQPHSHHPHLQERPSCGEGLR